MIIKCSNKQVASNTLQLLAWHHFVTLSFNMYVASLFSHVSSSVNGKIFLLMIVNCHICAVFYFYYCAQSVLLEMPWWMCYWSYSSYWNIQSLKSCFNEALLLGTTTESMEFIHEVSLLGGVLLTENIVHLGVINVAHSNGFPNK